MSESARFFFSSRRRHTRCLSDWSSDVCSSDLHHLRAGHGLCEALAGDGVDAGIGRGGDDLVAALAQHGDGLRSEERRVGERVEVWVEAARHKKRKTKEKQNRTKSESRVSQPPE